MGDATVPIFPRHQDSFCLPLTLPNDTEARPTSVWPIFNIEKSQEPLTTFDAAAASLNYGAFSLLDGEASPPPRPNTFTDDYLYPTLAPNEYTRLTMFWYYTKDIEQDKELLSKLTNLINVIKDSIGWELGLVGLLDNDTYVRLAAANLPLAILPRRESTCSHTVSQQPGTVFMITDLSKDWRFERSPHVEVGGIRSYAGTQLRAATPTGEVVVLGSICVASMTVQSPLSEEHKKTLIRGADIVAAEILSSARTRRLRARQKMGESLSNLRTNIGQRNIEELVIEILKDQYKNAHVTIQMIQNDTIKIQGLWRVPCSSVHAGLWEDTAYIQENLQFFDSRHAEVQRPIRAIVGHIKSNTRVLVVASPELKLVFDDLDSWFVDQCAQVVNLTLQDYALKQALAAKEAFLRGITHQLRTPIHGILSSTELLGEELRAQKLVQVNGDRRLNENDASLASCMHNIQRSGIELMTIVNNMLRLNAFTSNNVTSSPTSYDLRNLESDVFDAGLASYFDSQFKGPSVRFEYKFSGAETAVILDADLLKDLLKCLVLNAMDATHQGSIVVTTTLEESRLKFDIVDTGIGISPADQDRIFLPFEKADHHTKGVGLGLSLANQSAATLGASLSLVSSQPGVGSHFQLDFQNVQVCSASALDDRKPVRYKHLPSKFYQLQDPTRNTHLLTHLSAHLRSRGLQESDTPQDSLIITNQCEPSQSDLDKVRSLEGLHMVVLVLDTVNNEVLKARLATEMKPHLTWPIAGPFFTARLDSLLLEADLAFGLRRLKISSVTATCNPRISSPAPVIPQATNGLSTACFTDVTPISGVPSRALIVDDNIVNLRVLQMYCKKRGLLHSKAINGNEAVANFCNAIINSESPFTLILMDLQMPECDGIVACQRIREFERQRNLPKSIIFMITGQDSPVDRKNSIGAGADEYFVKPVSLKMLDMAIDHYFPGRLKTLPNRNT